MTNSERQAADQSDAFRLLRWWADTDAVEKQLVVDIRAKGSAFVENALQFTDEYIVLASKLAAQGSAAMVTAENSLATTGGSQRSLPSSLLSSLPVSRAGTKAKYRKTAKYGLTTDSRERWTAETCKEVFKLMLKANPKQLANIADFCRHIATSLPGSRTGASIRGQYDRHFVYFAGLTDKPMPPMKDYAVEGFRLAKEEVDNEELQRKVSPKQQPDLPLRIWLDNTSGQDG